MNKLHQLAIELKYEGKSYKEISEGVNRAFTPDTLKKYLTLNGLLYNDYLIYEATQNKMREAEGRALFKKTVLKASQALIEVLDRARDKKDDKTIIEVSNTILDRAGVVVIRKSEVNQINEDPQPISDEQLAEEYRKQGFDPETGLRLSKSADQSDKTV